VNSWHRPVLYQEILQALQPRSSGRYIDGTVGAGGHAFGILEASSPDGLLLGLDVDPTALSLAKRSLAQFGSRAILIQASYVTMSQQVKNRDWAAADGIVLDLGVSSMQLDTVQRGFSFLADAPLDMRFDPGGSLTAADLVNQLTENELADLIYRYGEETDARRIAHAIVLDRPVETTGQLAEIIQRTVKRSGGRQYNQRSTKDNRESGAGFPRGRTKPLHPATRTFQALRIAVNKELESLEYVLPEAISILAPGGRLAVISFHSLEDRIVKQFFRRESRDCICPPHQPVCTCGHRATITEIARRPIRPSQIEVEQNPRSRSARLRVAERVNN